MKSLQNVAKLTKFGGEVGRKLRCRSIFSFFFFLCIIMFVCVGLGGRGEVCDQPSTGVSTSLACTQSSEGRGTLCCQSTLHSVSSPSSHGLKKGGGVLSGLISVVLVCY